MRCITMFKYVFTFIGILIAGTALAEGAIFSAVIIFAFFALLGTGIDKLIGDDDKDTVGKHNADESTATNTSENIEEKEEDSNTADLVDTPDEKTEDWICPNCGSSNNGNFCEECGNKRPEEKVCKKCGAKLEDDQKYCEECGTKIE